ncbi:MAG: peptidoglycan DD-metalloendopeptidase family protein [Anaerolineae bacterium]|nr:peptidoglycan DD-metalloendopeptidase family protein [Anaerolineae bacterium]
MRSRLPLLLTGSLIALVLFLSATTAAIPISAQTAVTFTPIYLIVTDTMTPSPTASPIYLIVTSTPQPQYLIVTSTPELPTPINSATAEARQTLAVVAGYQDHFLFRRPFADDFQTFWARNYSYGSTNEGTLRVHHGIDISNPPGTPILAASGGVVYYAGKDVPVLFGPQPNFYGNVIVIEHPFTDANGQKVYSLYGHLSRLDVAVGQVVQAGQTIGIIGATGVAAGTHLHFEVRVGDPNSYLSSRNPELWVQPYPYRGVIAGRVLDADGKPLMGVRVEAQADTGYQSAYSYGDTEVNGDSVLGENFVIPDLAEGNYKVFVRQPDKNLYGQGRVEVRAGHVSWVEFKAVGQ